MSTISLVTGANRGIGREVCRQLTELGHTVILTARDARAAAAAARAVRAEPLTLDVTDPAGPARAARWTQDRYGRLDVLINNAAITYDTWQRPVTAGAASVVWAATLPDSGPTGGFFRDGQPLPW
jgi:NAD(P)-dependent dehydrogenase (short-subunit alcohol dehydrogenase family)